jgi:hypothetical protein
MAYTIIESHSMNGLIAQVTDSIKKGWKPQGGVCASNGFFYQAMIR